MKIIFALLGFIIFILLIRLLSSDGGISEYATINERLLILQEKNQQLVVNNNQLKKEVIELQTGTKIIETIARQKLGMIKNDEVFIRVIEVEN